MLIYAHRGARCEAAENTRAAFDRALEYPIDGIETDVQLTRDEVSVLWHDSNLSKLGLADKRIDDFDLSHLQQMNFAAFFADAHESAQVLTLQSFIQDYHTRCRLLIEIKNCDEEPAERHEIKMRQALQLCNNPERQMLISSFHLESLVRAHNLQPSARLVYNLEPEQSLQHMLDVLTQHTFLSGLCLPLQTLDQERVSHLRKQQKLIAVYTCNSEQEILTALDLQVDILITDLPARALALRALRT